MTCRFRFLLLFLFITLTAGCSTEEVGEESPDDASVDPIEISGLPPGDFGTIDDHGHGPHDGPHGGLVVELGRNHKYHAEIVEPENKGVSLYILDEDLEQVDVETTNLVVNLRVGDTAKSFTFSVASDDSSRFDVDDDSLLTHLHDPQVSGKIRVAIGGTTYSGSIEHHQHD